MKKRVKICRIISYIGIVMVIVVYLIMAYISSNADVIEKLPSWTGMGLQFLLGTGSALTISGVVLGLYYKSRIRRDNLGKKGNRR